MARRGWRSALLKISRTAAQLDPYRVRGPRGLRLNPQYKGKPMPHIAVTSTLSAGEFTSGVGITDPSAV